jgi:hypothetical protein
LSTSKKKFKKSIEIYFVWISVLVNLSDGHFDVDVTKYVVVTLDDEQEESEQNNYRTSDEKNNNLKKTTTTITTTTTIITQLNGKRLEYISMLTRKKNYLGTNFYFLNVVLMNSLRYFLTLSLNSIFCHPKLLRSLK